LIKLLYRALGLLAGLLGAVLAGAIFRRIWKVAGAGASRPDRGEHRGGLTQAGAADRMRWRGGVNRSVSCTRDLLPAFCAKIVGEFAGGKHPARPAARNPDPEGAGMSRALDEFGELDPGSRAHMDRRSVRVPRIPDGDRSRAGPDFDAVAVREAVAGLPPVDVDHVTYCVRLITLRELQAKRSVRYVIESLQLVYEAMLCTAQPQPSTVTRHRPRVLASGGLLAERCDQLPAEGGQVVGFAAGRQRVRTVAAQLDLSIHQVTAGVADVGLQAGP
jgi:hypothetical protein